MAENLAPKRRVDDKAEPWQLKTRPEKCVIKPMTNLSLGGRKPGPKKAMGAALLK
jgi:hypothetical protein